MVLHVVRLQVLHVLEVQSSVVKVVMNQVVAQVANQETDCEGMMSFTQDHGEQRQLRTRVCSLSNLHASTSVTAHLLSGMQPAL